MAWRALRDKIEALGVAGAAGVALLVFAALSAAIRVPESAVANESLRAELQRLALRAAGAARTGRQHDAAAQLRAFHDFFPVYESLPEWLDTLEMAARDRGFSLGRVEYRLARDDGAGLLRYEAALALRGEYARIAGFVTGFLAAAPPAALDELKLRRDSASSAVLEAQLRFSIFLRDG